MRVRRLNQKGSHVVGFMMLIAVIGLIGFAGWRVMKRQSVSNNPVSNQNGQIGGEYRADITSKLQLQQVKLTGTGTQGLDIDEETGLVYAGAYSGINNKCLPGDLRSEGQSLLNIIDPGQAKEIAAVATDRAPIWPAVDKQRDVVYVAASSGSVAIHKRSSGEKVGSIDVGGLPHMPALLGNIMVVSNTYNQSQTYYSAVNLDTRKVIGNYQGPKFPHPIVVDEEQRLAYMMGVEAAEVITIDMITGKPKGTFRLEGGGGQMAISKKLQKIVTSSSRPGTSAAIFDLNSKKNLGTLGFEGVNSPGSGLAIDEESGLVFVVISDQNALGVASLDTLKPLAYFKTGGCPYAVKVDSKRGKGYVTNSGDGSLTVFDLDSVKDALGQ